MLVVEHPDDDAEEPRYFGQLMRTTARVIVSLINNADTIRALQWLDGTSRKR